MSHIQSPPLPKVQTQKQFTDILYDRIRSPRTLSDDKSAADRPAGLQTYLVENNSEMRQEFHTENLQVNIDQTGLDHIKILTLTDSKKPERRLQFYLDKTDARFLVFHTFEPTKDANPMIMRMINSSRTELDNAWLPAGFLTSVSKEFGNVKYGYDMHHKDHSHQKVEDIGPMKPDTCSHVSTSGKTQRLLMKNKDVSGLIKVRIDRGTKNTGIVDDLYYDGRFDVVEGDSIDDHIILVNTVKDRYAALIRRIEDCQIYGNEITGSIKGRPIAFRFDRKVDDWDYFLTQMFDSKEPFRAWGIRNKIDDKFYQILGVDTHTDHPFDMEVTDGLFRVYLPRGSCGNLITRLFVNLQRFFDSQIRCSDMEVKQRA